MANNGSENALFRNEGNLQFRGRPILGGAAGTEALVPGDVNGDGLLDLLGCVWGGYATLYLGNDRGWFFEATPEAGLPVLPDGRCGGAALGDLDGDGDPDLYLPDGRQGDRLFANDGGYFVEVTQAAGFTPVPQSESALMADFTDDGQLDLYVARYDAASMLYCNLGGMRFEPLDTGAFGADQQLGASAFDADGDGDLDLLITGGRFSEEGAPLRLLANLGGGEFVDATPAEWLAEPRRHHSACTGDIDNDGDLDVFDSSLEGCTLWLGDGAGGFSLATGVPDWGAIPGAGAVLCDLDADGDLDVLLRARQTEADTFAEYLFRNDLNDANWLEVRPVDSFGNRFCQGAQVRLYRAGALGQAEGLVARRDLTSLCGWCSYVPFVAHFGVPAGETHDIEVRFADGSRGTAQGVRPGQCVQVAAQTAGR
jgi:hypothetical protein